MLVSIWLLLYLLAKHGALLDEPTLWLLCSSCCLLNALKAKIVSKWRQPHGCSQWATPYMVPAIYMNKCLLSYAAIMGSCCISTWRLSDGFCIGLLSKLCSVIGPKP
ncbi:hypothetical protein U1Q18_033392 [Sarracenia purpurea var. burkii]